MDSGRLGDLKQEEYPKTFKVLKKGIADRVAPGFVAGVWRKDDPEQFHLMAVGQRRWLPSPQPMLVDTLFDLASVTKVFATATLAALLVERKWLNWETPVSALLPHFSWKDIRLKHLLSHTAGFPAWIPFWKQLEQEFKQLSPRSPLYQIPICERQKKMRELVIQISPESSPGQKTLYSDISFLLLGFALEEAVSMPLDLAVEEWVWRPMDLQSAFFRRVDQSVERGYLEQVAATELCPWRGKILQGQVHDENCWSMGGYAGHAGAFATAADLLRFSKKLMSGFLSPDTMKMAWSREGGWDVPSGSQPAVGQYFSHRSVGHLGFTGTSLWIDLNAGLAVVLLSNRVHPSRENMKLKSLRPQFHDAIRLDIENNKK